MTRPPSSRPEEWPRRLDPRRPDPDRLAHLARQIEANDYYVPPEKVADAIIEF